MQQKTGKLFFPLTKPHSLWFCIDSEINKYKAYVREQTSKTGIICNVNSARLIKMVSHLNYVSFQKVAMQ